MAAQKPDTYIVKRPFGGHAEGDEIPLNPRQAQFLVSSGQVKKKPARKRSAGGGS